MEQIVSIIKGIDKNVLGILITSLIAFLSWIVKGLIEIPLNNAKEIFYKFFEKRIELLGDLKMRLSIIANFPNDESKEYKEQIQEILLKEGKAAYLDSKMFANILYIAINPYTDEQRLLDTIEDINTSLSAQIAKVEQSNDFFSKYSNVNPVKRLVGYLLLAIYYIATIIFIGCLIWLLFNLLLTGTLTTKFLALACTLIAIFLLNWWISK